MNNKSAAPEHYIGFPTLHQKTPFYHFWNPQSGFIGGMMVGVLIFSVSYAFANFLHFIHPAVVR